MKKTYALVAVVLLLLTGCETDMRKPDAIFADEAPAGVRVTFSAVIDEQTGSALTSRSRATATAWETGDLIGITCGTTQNNIQYAYNGDGTFAATGGVAEEIWVLGTQTYPVSAYYPFAGTSGSTPDAVAFSTGSDYQQTASARAAIDWLYASTEVNESDPSVTLNFSHKMSKLKIQFEGADGYTLSTIKLYLIGLMTEGTFDTTTGEVIADEESVNDIYWGDINASDNYAVEAILIPQTIGDKLYFQAGMEGVYYEEAFDISELQPGVSYNYTISVEECVDNPFKLTVREETQIYDWIVAEGDELAPSVAIPDAVANPTTPDWVVDTEVITPQEIK